MNYYCHITPGRLRIKTPIIKQNPVEIAKVRDLLEPVRGVDALSINALTGSITVNYSSCLINAESILEILTQNGYYQISKAIQPEHAMEAAVSRAGAALGKLILGAAVEKALEGSMFSFLAFLV